VVSVGDLNEFLNNLLKKHGGHLERIWHENLVTLDEECGNRSGKYTRLEIS